MGDFSLNDLIGKRCGKDDRLEIRRMLGEGGVGAVFEAYDTVRETRYAIKFLLESWANDAELVRRFRHEGVRWKEIHHPHLVRIHGLGKQFGMPFILSEFVEGKDLQDVVDLEGALDVGEALRFTREMASALAEVHRNDIVHRDLKPQNVMIQEPQRAVKILDFGMAKYMNSDSMLTRPGMIVGTPGFISPEQIRGEELDHRSDIFSLGAILYEMLTGQKAFIGATVKEGLRKTAHGEYESIPKARKGTARPIVALVDEMLRDKPAKRPKDMNEIVARIETIESDPANLTVEGGGRVGRRVLGFLRKATGSTTETERVPREVPKTSPEAGSKTERSTGEDPRRDIPKTSPDAGSKPERE